MIEIQSTLELPPHKGPYTNYTHLSEKHLKDIDHSNSLLSKIRAIKIGVTGFEPAAS